MGTLILDRNLAKAVARQPQGLDAVIQAEQSGDLLDELQYYIPPDRIAGLHQANEVSGHVDNFIAIVKACVKLK